MILALSCLSTSQLASFQDSNDPTMQRCGRKRNKRRESLHIIILACASCTVSATTMAHKPLRTNVRGLSMPNAATESSRPPPSAWKTAMQVTSHTSRPRVKNCAQKNVPVFRTLTEYIVGSLDPSTATTVMFSVRSSDRGSGKAKCIKTSNFVELLLHCGQTTVDLYSPCAPQTSQPNT